MKRYFFCVVALVAILAVSSVAALAAPKEEKPVLLQVPVAFATNLPGLGDGIMYIANNIELASNGSVKMKVFEPGKLVAPFEVLDAVSKGKVNAGYSTAGYWEGKLPAAPLFSAVPFGPETGEYLAWFYYGNGMKLYQEMYDKAGYNVKVLLAAIIAPETSGWFTKEIKSAADLKGMRMRFFGLGGKVMEKLGVSVSLLPAGEIFPALEKRALDATEFSMPAIDERLGFFKIAKYNYYPGWHQQATTFELLINKEVWNGLSDHQKKIIEVTCKASVADSFAHTEAIQGKVIRENAEKRHVKNMKWSKEMLDLYKKTWHDVAAAEAARDPFFKKVWEDFRTFDKDYDLWASLGFLSR
ncbi:MAG: TRAP transporter substrate-binding protein [Deltaproteobacteria bacterium]|nr:TRAP transporter substrate-binding protein [Deltaproteobacteria bacterium]